MEIEVPVVKMRKPRVKRTPAEPVAAPPPEPPPEPEPEPIVEPVKPARKPRATKKKDEPQQQLSVADVPSGASDDLQTAPHVEMAAAAAPPSGEVSTGDVRPFTEVVKKKRGPYKPRSAKTSPTAAPAADTVVAPGGPTEQLHDPNYWVALDATLKSMRLQAKHDRYARFVLA